MSQGSLFSQFMMYIEALSKYSHINLMMYNYCTRCVRILAWKIGVSFASFPVYHPTSHLINYNLGFDYKLLNISCPWYFSCVPISLTIALPIYHTTSHPSKFQQNCLPKWQMMVILVMVILMITMTERKTYKYC